MKKKGFTLIELLAVIVILAIIALIATPIILGIINDAREESNERSVELYASAVRNGIAAYQLREGKEVTAGTYNETNKLPFEVEYDGQVDCTSVIISESGKVTLEGCTVNGGTKEYSYGIEEETPEGGEIPNPGETPSTQVYKPQYYSWYSGYIGEGLPSDAKTTVAELNTSYPFYLGFDVDSSNTVTAIYSCFRRNDQEYCLKGYDAEAYETNVEIIKDAYVDVVDTKACAFGEDSYSCEDSDFRVMTALSGLVIAGEPDVLFGESAYCSVDNDGYSLCEVVSDSNEL